MAGTQTNTGAGWQGIKNGDVSSSYGWHAKPTVMLGGGEVNNGVVPAATARTNGIVDFPARP